MAAPQAPRPELHPAFHRTGRLYAAMWLAYLVYPLASLAGPHLEPWRRLAGAAGLAAFVAAYLWSWGGDITQPGLRSLLAAGLATALGAALVRLLGLDWVGLFIYASVLVARLPSPRAAVAGVAAVTAAAMASLRPLHLGAGAALSWGLSTAVSGLGTVGLMRLVATVRALREAQEEIARLAAVEERLRIARDVHDLVGHSLSVIALKADLAGRLLATGDTARAAAEVADVQAVARRSLGEVRAAVAGYRRLSLDEELALAREGLQAAGIRCAFLRPPEPLPPDADATLAWVVREAATNVLRHSGATTCQIRVARKQDRVEVQIEDDGVGPAEQRGAGSGLRGLAERLRREGGGLTVGRAALGGFQLRAWVPVAPLPEEQP